MPRKAKPTEATPEPSNHNAAATTASWAAGRATLFVFVERTVSGPATERVSLETKTIDIAANLATAVERWATSTFRCD